MLHSKFWQAFFALAPILMLLGAVFGYLILIFSMFSDFQEIESSGNISGSIIFGGMGIFLVLIFLAVFIALASLVFYIVHAVQNPNLKANNLLLVWIILFVFVGGIGQLLYWIIEIVNKRKHEETIAQSHSIHS